MAVKIEEWLESNYPKSWTVISFCLKWRIAFIFVSIFFYVKYDRQDRVIDALQEKLGQVERTNAQLLSESFVTQRNLDKLPFALWKKQKMGRHFVMKFINKTASKQILEGRNIDRYFYHNKTDFAVFPYEEARKFYVEDSIIASAQIDTIAHFDTDFYNAVGDKIIKDGYTRWREVVENDTFIWGKMDRFYREDLQNIKR